jgi:hypothetical protein
MWKKVREVPMEGGSESEHVISYASPIFRISVFFFLLELPSWTELGNGLISSLFWWEETQNIANWWCMQRMLLFWVPKLLSCGSEIIVLFCLPTGPSNFGVLIGVWKYFIVIIYHACWEWIYSLTLWRETDSLSSSSHV